MADNRVYAASSDFVTLMRQVNQTIAKTLVMVLDRHLKFAQYTLQHCRFTEKEPARLSHLTHGYCSYLVKILTLFAIYLSTARFSLSFDAVSRFATLVWFPSGIALAALLLFGCRLWPGILMGAFLVNLFNGAPLFVAVGIGIGNTLEALVGTYLLKHHGVRTSLDHLRDVLVLVLLAMPLSALISATLGVSSLFLGKVIAFSSYFPTWRAWWLGDMMSILILTPFLLTWSKWPHAKVAVKRSAEIGMLTVFILAVCSIVFLGLLQTDQRSYPMTYLVFPPLIWAALRFGPRGAISAIFAVSTLAIVGTIQGAASFSPSRLSERLILLQSFMGIIAVTSMILAAVMAERRELEQRKQERMLALATTDPVTELPNHRALMVQLEQELERAGRYERACSILFFDLDHFKALNDGYGHAAGDAVLCEFASLIQARLRRMDTVGRWGGEEFVAILPEMQADEALALAEEVRAVVAAHTFSVGGGLHLTCSVGMASCPTHAQEREGLIAAADHAMYGAKRFGRNQVRVANDPAILALFPISHPEGGREETALVGVAEALVTLVEARDHLTGQHSHQVAALALELAMSLDWPASEAQMLELAGQLHDIGKVAIPETILQKPGPLTTQERDVMHTHPVVGADVISHIPALRPLAPVIRAHHERWDGQGYPDQLAREAIPLAARILAVADAYQAMIVDRPYQPARASAAALAELRRCAGSQFDPQVVEALVHQLRGPEDGGG
jgi:diguanylate cyclase (GGDEF)-like protein